ncbi:MAG: hypothetical protein U5R06_10970 [candidate division KSB1 bacterium]|nr:hypothetical protein [candidate division KSB1 bacterium]
MNPWDQYRQCPAYIPCVGDIDGDGLDEINGGMLWNDDGRRFRELPGLLPEKGDKRQGWYHCIPVDCFKSRGEEMLVYNPWDRYVFLYTKPGETDLNSRHIRRARDNTMPA